MFGADAVAGLTASAIVIPKAMALAVIAGLAVEAGLYTALAAMLIYPLLGSSRVLSVSTTSALAMLIASIEEPAVIAKILAHLERTAPEQHQPERPLGARAPPAQSSLL
jgi:MFS superfamily sulfate permease-like transporter